MSRNGAPCILVSGGFTCFTGRVAEQLGFHHHHGNTLVLKDGRLTGEVGEPILDHQAKLDYLHHYTRHFGLTPDDVLAVGDGANDLGMLAAAGLGVGFHPKPYLQERVENSVLYGDLTCLLFLQGITDF
jgi:phosphoserine phosphatase